ncbi:MAG: excisionase family DNA-binding protein [Oscillospiraceae bacterium]|nr:excisionase family DNA-binding protein [Oscillospiraceae bacterium]
MNKKEKQNAVPIWEKAALSIEEAAAYTGIGENKLRELTQYDDCDYVIWVGNKRLIKRKKFEEYLDKAYSI